jgi:hypothetical protein
MMKEQFDFMVEPSKMNYATSFKGDEITIADFPLMFLALQVKEKSPELLAQIVADQHLSEEVRLRAFAILYSINETHAQSLFTTLESTLAPQLKQYFLEFLSEPGVAPWAIPGAYSPRAKQAAKHAEDIGRGPFKNLNK